MITIVNYDREASNSIAKILTDLEVVYKVSSKELDIISAKKLILPDGKDINIIFRKLQLLNLYSLLKMVNQPSNLRDVVSWNREHSPMRDQSSSRRHPSHPRPARHFVQNAIEHHYRTDHTVCCIGLAVLQSGDAN